MQTGGTPPEAFWRPLVTWRRMLRTMIRRPKSVCLNTLKRRFTSLNGSSAEDVTDGFEESTFPSTFISADLTSVCLSSLREEVYLLKWFLH